VENKYMSAKNLKGEIICEKVKLANNMFTRLLGLMFSKDLPINEGLLIRPCNSIHTFFMNYSLDIVFLDKEFCVVKVIYNMRPWRMSWMYFKASQVLEMKAGNLKSNIAVGEKLEVLCIS
jgi:uncharacterized membrane protein (UPF0127 family)